MVTANISTCVSLTNNPAFIGSVIFMSLSSTLNPSYGDYDVINNHYKLVKGNVVGCTSSPANFPSSASTNTPSLWAISAYAQKCQKNLLVKTDCVILIR